MPSFDLGYAASPHRSKRPGFDGTSLQAFFAAFPDDDACLAHVFKKRFGDNPTCPRCGGTERWRRHEVQKHYFHPCGGILSPMTGVFFSRSHIPPQLWFYAMLHFANSSGGVSSPFLARQMGVSLPSAYRVSKRIRAHMAAIDEKCLLGAKGETVIVRISKILNINNNRKNVQNSATLLLMCDKYRVNSTIIMKPTQRRLRILIKNKTNHGSRIVTDCYRSSRILNNYSNKRPLADFSPNYYSDKSPSENLNHGFLQYFNLSFRDQFKGVTLEKAWLYLKEYEFRYNRRRRSGHIYSDMISRFPLIGEEGFARLQGANFIEAET